MGKLFTITDGLENMGALKTGGQGSVYKGRRTGAVFSAVKLLPTPIHSESVTDKHFRDFQNEVEKLKKVSEPPNPHVVQILGSGITETGSLPFIEMEFIEGPDLEELLQPPHQPIFTLKEVLKVAEQLSAALAHCHGVGVRHGDVKSNNVKLNLRTGNYVLLDFGLAIMTDEQRRTSLRHAGAVEFMAPEQTEGRMMFETDVYAFGIILYELLAGTVPFPLKDGSELARNRVMLAHIETAPPDVVAARRTRLPAAWAFEKAALEAAIPPWMQQIISTCLQKQPEDRFENGVALHEAICARSAEASNPAADADLLKKFQAENQQLRDQNMLLEQQLQQAGKPPHQRDTATKAAARSAQPSMPPQQRAAQKLASPTKKRSFGVPSLLLFVMVVVALVGAYAMFGSNGGTPAEPRAEPQQERPKAVLPPPADVIQNNNLGQFKVQADKAYFHSAPEDATRRNAYLLHSSEALIDGWDERNNFIYTEYTNSRGQVTKGWLKRDDLMPAAEWDAQKQAAQAALPQRLQQARDYIANDRVTDAVAILAPLAADENREAQFEMSNLALQGKWNEMSCDEATQMLKKASAQAFAPARRTLGLLYVFAESPRVMAITNYDRCPHEKNIVRGSKLLLQAMLAGDSAAGKWLQFHKEETAADSLAN